MPKRITKSPVIDEEITRIYKEQNGQVKASVVLSESTPEEAPLHDFFEWDDTKAGHEFRLTQSRRIIRVAVVEIKPDKREKLIHVPQIEINNGREGCYKPAEIIAQRIDEFSMAMREASMRLHSAERSVKALENAAKQLDKEDETVALISIAMRAILTASESVRAIST